MIEFATRSGGAALIEFDGHIITIWAGLAANHPATRIPTLPQAARRKDDAEQLSLFQRRGCDGGESAGGEITQIQIQPRILPRRNRVIHSVTHRLSLGRSTLKHAPVISRNI
jgi:hypothetical protein